MSTNHPHRSRTGSEHGFSLIDVAVVMAIVGVLLAGFLATYKLYQATRATNITEENFLAAQEALGAFIPFKDSRYPVPSPFGLAEQVDPNYGLEGGTSDFATCTDEASARKKVCVGKVTIDGTEREILIGTLPFADINMSDTQARDGYGRLFTYAVARDLTVVNGAEPTILLEDLNGDGTQDPDEVERIYKHYVCVKTQILQDNGNISKLDDTESDCTAANFNPPRAIALISHGSDGVGGWLPSGKLYAPCGLPTGGSGRAQNENCNFDGTFVQAVRRTQIEGQSTPLDTSDDVYMTQPMLVRGEGVDKNDDTVQAEVREDGNYWGNISADMKVQNNHNYRVGIGVDNPQSPLDVKGNVMAQKGVLAQELCQGTHCLKVATLAGEEQVMNCGRMGLVQGIQNNAAACVKAVTYGANCAADQMVAGFDSYGNPICRTLTKPTCGIAHGKVYATAPPASDRCIKGTVEGFSGGGPWSWRCNLTGKMANCATVASTPPETPTPACIDECGETRFDGSTWCRAGSYKGRSRCNGTSVVDEGCISGIGCCGAGTLHCR